MISAGRVLPMPKGDYNALTTYEFLDIVSDNGNSYILKVDTSTGNPPTDTTKWQILAYGGSAANVAADFSANIEATQYASQSYAVGDFLVDKDSKLCRVTAAILQGSEIIIGTNVEVTSVTALVRTVEESIAVVETKIASYSHDIGDHFYLSDVLYKATAAIQAGDTLTSGTNITPAVDVCTQINELASDTETAIQGVKDLLAPSEDGSTAVLSYSIGDEFIRNGALCKAKTAITSGDTLVFNTNYEDAGVAMDQLVSVNEALSKYSSGYLPIVDLGNSYTAELKADISSGAFKKAVVGGMLTINNHVYYLAHPDYWLNTGDTKCTTHHMLVIPAGNLASGKMNNDNSTAGGYFGSGMKSGTNHDESANSALADVAAIIKADFGAANILTHREDFTNAVADGKPSAGAWYNSDIDLMNENMVYGTNIFLPHPDGSTIPNLYTIDKTQIKLFAERPDLITIRDFWWLRDVVSAAGFSYVDYTGDARYANASTSLGVRPAFAIC